MPVLAVFGFLCFLFNKNNCLGFICGVFFDEKQTTTKWVFAPWGVKHALT